MESHIHIHGEGIQIIPHAEHVQQNHLLSPAVSAKAENPEGSPLQSLCRLYVGHDSANVPSLLRKAERHIVLHAAYYPKYGIDSQGMVLMEALKENPGLKLRVIFTRTDKNPWLAEFARILRPFYTKKTFVSALTLSRDFFVRLSEMSLPGQVTIVSTRRLPLFPVILVDDTIVVGHYAHSSTIAPHGLWLTIHNPKISGMYEALMSRTLDVGGLNDEERAILRYVEECVPAAF